MELASWIFSLLLSAFFESASADSVLVWLADSVGELLSVGEASVGAGLSEVVGEVVGVGVAL